MAKCWLEAMSCTLLFACATSSVHHASEASFSTRPSSTTLTILHASDCESELLPSAGGVAGISRFAAIVAALRARARGEVLVFAAGDTFMPAPALQLDDGVSVARANAIVGFQASSLGNHEFDRGDDFLAEMIARAPFPYLSATLAPREGPLAALVVAPLETPWLDEHPGKLLRRAKRCIGTRAPSGVCEGTVVGVVGATTETLREISRPSQRLDSARTIDEVRTLVQREVNALIREGIGIVILLSHLQDVEQELRLVEAGLTGVDVIVAGGGDDRLASRDHRLLPGDAPAPVCARTPHACYPLVRRAHDGKPVLVVATDGQYRYVGALEVTLDDDGVVTGFNASSKAWPADDLSRAELAASEVAAARTLEDEVRLRVEPLVTPFADNRVFLNGLREDVRNRETNLGNLSADAMRWAARRAMGPRVQFALRNGGGIRAAIGTIEAPHGTRTGRPLTPLDVQSALRFDNRLVVLTLSREELRRSLEAALVGAGSGRGRFPQVSEELFLAYLPGEPPRIATLELRGADGTRQVIVDDGETIDPRAEVTFATLEYLATGGDGWFAAPLEVRAVLPATEQTALRGYVDELVRSGRWAEGRSYPDPIPGRPESFRRIRALETPPR